ncbi:MAG TPA: hypothetical protein PLN52_09835 [Opitutaceae bacterium]|nr:hypothetical protein [Opitutaceae bacterium]
MLPNLSLSRLMTATLTPPRLVLSQDAVLMTRPVLEGAEENVEEQRQMALQASQRQLPAAFAGAELSEGILFSIPAALLSRSLAHGQSFRKERSFIQQAPPLVWKDAAGLSVDLGKSAAGRTELVWKRVLAAPGRYRLVDLRGQCWAEVEVGERGQVEVAVVPHVQTQVWIEARFNHEQSAPSDKAPWRDRLIWKSLDGRNLPRKSELGPSVLPDGSLRMEWVVEAKPGANLTHHVALVDTVSHWAWLSVVQQTF